MSHTPIQARAVALKGEGNLNKGVDPYLSTVSALGADLSTWPHPLSVTQPHSQPVTQSHSQSVTQSHSQSVTQPPDRKQQDKEKLSGA